MEHKGHIQVEFCNKLLCRACLSSDRSLSPIGNYLEILQNICGNSGLDRKSEINLCWECIAALKKIKLFKDKVIKAQTLLSYCNFYQKNFPICLSNLTVADTNNVATLFVIEHEIETKIEHEIETEIEHEIETEIEHEIETETGSEPETEYETEHKLIDIKLEKEPELEDNGNDFCEDTQNDYVCLEVSKSESDSLYKEVKKLNKEEDVKKQITPPKKKRRKNYSIVVYSTKDLLKKVKIGQNEVNTWREKVRNGQHFKNLKSKCKKCLIQYSTEALKRHNMLFHDKSPGQYMCDICQSYFSSKQTLASHIRGHYILFECKKCAYQCYTKEHFSTHVRVHKRMKTVQCLECDESFRTITKFFAHFKAKHTGVACSYCGKVCYSKFVLEKHMKHNHNVRCDICKIDFKKSKKLRLHIKLKHVKAPTEDAFCVTCNKQFDNVHVYRQHVYTSAAHAPERSHRKVRDEQAPCPECGKVYKRKTYMNNHYRKVHLGQSKFYCKDHDKQFLNSTSYGFHMKYVHEGQERTKDKICNICGRGFHQSVVLTHHMRTHTGEKPYACAHCDARFAQRTAMLSHVKHIHLKENRKGGYPGPLVG